MDADTRVALGRRLRERLPALAARWHEAIGPTAFPPLPPAAVLGELDRLAAAVGAILLAEPFAPGGARAVGAALVALRYLTPEALGATQRVLGSEMIADLPIAQLPAVLPRLLALLGELATGFVAAGQGVLLAEQEAARAVPLAQRRRAEAALRASEARLRAVVGDLPVLLFVLDRRGVFTLADGKGLAALGLAPERVVGRAVAELFAGAPALLAAARRALAGEPCSVTAAVGGLVLEAWHTPVRDGAGAVAEVIGVAADITERTRAEERLRAVIANAPVVLFAFDAAGTVTLAEGQGLAPLGLSGGELVGRSLLDLYRAAPTVLANVRRALAGEAFEAVVAVAGVAFETRYAPLRDAAGAVAGVIGVATDVTARVRAEAERDEARRRLLAGREAAQVALARELHDGPVQELYGLALQLATLADELPVGDPRARLTARLVALERLAGALHAISRDLRPPTLAPFGLAAALREHARRVGRDHPGLTLRLEVPRDDQALPEATGLALFRIAQEALWNAVRHAAAGTVWVRLAWGPATITVAVRDDGVGFAPPAPLGALTGHGHLGLAGAGERAEALGGRLMVESAPGRGTTVRATIPRPIAGPPAAAVGSNDGVGGHP